MTLKPGDKLRTNWGMDELVFTKIDIFNGVKTIEIPIVLDGGNLYKEEYNNYVFVSKIPPYNVRGMTRDEVEIRLWFDSSFKNTILFEIKKYEEELESEARKKTKEREERIRIEKIRAQGEDSDKN